jgi:hypothetical protein
MNSTFRCEFRIAALASVAVIALASCETPPPTRAYSSTAPDQAVLIHYNNKWSPIFDKVDLQRGVSAPKHEGVRTEGIPEKFDYASKRVTPEIEQRLGLKGGKSGRIDTGYGVTVWEPGDYAMIGILQFYVTGPGGYNLNAWCFPGQAPVFHIEAGLLNVFEPQNEMQARINAGASYDPALVKREEDQIRFVLEEFPILRGEVRLAPVVASVRYYKPQVKNPNAMCDHDSHFTVGPPKPLPPEEPK